MRDGGRDRRVEVDGKIKAGMAGWLVGIVFQWVILPASCPPCWHVAPETAAFCASCVWQPGLIAGPRERRRIPRQTWQGSRPGPCFAKANAHARCPDQDGPEARRQCWSSTGWQDFTRNEPKRSGPQRRVAIGQFRFEPASDRKGTDHPASHTQILGSAAIPAPSLFAARWSHPRRPRCRTVRCPQR